MALIRQHRGQATGRSARAAQSATVCKQCRRSKVRCSGGRPCERCLRRRDTCTYTADDAFVSVPEHYMRELLRRADESSLHAPTSAPTPTPMCPDASAAHSNSDPDPTAIAADAQSSEIRAVSVGTGPSERGATEGEMTYVRSLDGRRLLYLGHTSTWSFCRRAFALLDTATPDSNVAPAPLNLDGAAFRLRWEPKSSIEACDLSGLPPADQALLLYHTVKFHLGELSALVDEHHFLSIFDQFHKNPLATAQNHRLWFVQYLLLLAFGKAYTSFRGQAALVPAGSDLAARALSLLPNVVFLQEERPSMLAVEVLSLSALYLQSIDMRSAAYQYIGQATRLCLHDGLHRRVSDSQIDARLSTRCGELWWTVYILDQEFTASQGLPPSVSLSCVTTPYPDVNVHTPSAKALALRARLSRLVSDLCGKNYSLDTDANSDFVRNIVATLHNLADISRDLDEVTLAFRTNQVALPTMFCSIALLYHYCILLTTRPLILALLSRSFSATTFLLDDASGPVTGLVRKSAQSASNIVMLLANMVEREILETFLPTQLEYAFSSIMLLSILECILPTSIPDNGWRQEIKTIFDEMTRKGNVVVPLRRAEWEHLEQQLALRGRANSSTQREAPFHRSLAPQDASMHITPSNVHEGEVDDPNRFGPSTREAFNVFEPFAMDGDEISALALQFEQEDFPYDVFPNEII